MEVLYLQVLIIHKASKIKIGEKPPSPCLAQPLTAVIDSVANCAALITIIREEISESFSYVYFQMYVASAIQDHSNRRTTSLC